MEVDGVGGTGLPSFRIAARQGVQLSVFVWKGRKLLRQRQQVASAIAVEIADGEDPFGKAVQTGKGIAL